MLIIFLPTPPRAHFKPFVLIPPSKKNTETPSKRLAQMKAHPRRPLMIARQRATYSGPVNDLAPTPVDRKGWSTCSPGWAPMGGSSVSRGLRSRPIVWRFFGHSIPFLIFSVEFLANRIPPPLDRAVLVSFLSDPRNFSNSFSKKTILHFFVLHSSISSTSFGFYGGKDSVPGRRWFHLGWV